MSKIENEVVIGAQGEVRIYKVDAVPSGVRPASVERTSKGLVISHSEKGHHHLLTGDCELLEMPFEMAGMGIFYAILKSPGALIQDAPVPHERYDFEAGDIIKFQCDQEYSPFLEEARRSAD